jgi:ribosomal protein L11 methyltransferase
MNTVEVYFVVDNANTAELLVAELAELHFEAFEEVADGVKAFIPQSMFDAPAIALIADQYALPYSVNTIAQQNWNALWESNFEPLVVNDLQTGKPWVGVRANFHPATEGVDIDIEITPKMSFGTGHHATTYSVMQLMKTVAFNNATVFDFGTGTGILAILAEKLGAKAVIAVDNDDWCIENAQENVQKNGCVNISVQKADTAASVQTFDVVIANINKHILLENMALLAERTKDGGVLILSGLLIQDEEDIVSAAEQQGFKHAMTLTKGNWIAILLNRS